MRAAAVLAVILAASGSYEAAIPYFSRVRDVIHIAPDRQNYFVIDPDIWKFARPDLADLRLYDGQSQVPFVIRQQSAGSSNRENSAKILNLGTIGDHAEFELDVRGTEEYSRVRLKLDAKNFISTAFVQGRQSANARSGTELGRSTLYDFTAEGLGSNLVLKFPTANFPYLHVRLTPGIRPAQIQGAYVASFSESKAAWITAGSCSAISGPPKQSVFECFVSPAMPVERIAFQIEPGAVNFNRTVIVNDETGGEIERGSVSRVRITREGQTVTSEDLAIEVYPRSERKIRVVVQNGDDKPLPVQQVAALSIERRLYFDPAGKTGLQLYYGDKKLTPPSYDYAKFFQPSAQPAIAELGIAGANSQFTGRPDERPWSERHPYVLWLVMLIAVAILAWVAVRGLVGEKQSQTS
jgi:hypothetical protein